MATPSKLIHVGVTNQNKLFLRQDEDGYRWYRDVGGKEEATPISAPSISEAIRLAYREWKLQHFHPMNCGFRYTVPERDEHGMNALFWEMGESYKSPTGIYFDESRGQNFFVNNASTEAMQFWRQLEKEGRL